MRKTTEKDFWSKVDRRSADECWEWTRCLSPDGYGKCLFLGEQLAHRASYRLVVGEIPEGLCVLHHCDNRKCVNPKHLFLGSRVINNADRDGKGRTAKGDKHGSRTQPGARPRGETHSRAKLTDAEIEEIRRRYAVGGCTHRSLAKQFGVSHTEIGHITRNEIRRNR